MRRRLPSFIVSVLVHPDGPENPRERPTRLRDRLDPGRPRLVVLGLLAFVLVQAWTVVASLHVPIVGEHDWRQSDTYSVAYNFVHASFDFFHPRIDWTYGRSGVMGMEAPILPFLGALAMKALGDEPAILRVIVFAFFASGLVTFARVLRAKELTSSWIGPLVVAVCAPMGLYESRQIQPDPFMCGLLMLAAATMHLFSKHGHKRHYFVGLFAYSCALLVKSPAVVAAPALFFLSFSARRATWREIIARGLGFLVPLGLLVAWTLWGKHLNATYNAGEVYFATEFDLDAILADLGSRPKLRNVLLFVLPIYTVGWPMLPAVFAGMVLGFSRPHRTIAWPMWAWLLPATLFLLCFGGRLMSHWYYALPAFPPLVWFGGLGLANVLAVAAGTAPPSRVSRFAAILVVVALPFARLVGGEPQTGTNVPVASRPVHEATWLTDGALAGFLLLVIVAYAISEVRHRTPHRVLLTIFAVASLALGLDRARHDSLAVFEHRAKVAEWSTFHATWDPLRRAADAYSTRQDVFVTDMGNPWYLYLANRRGFADPAFQVSGRTPSYYRARRARFFVHYSEAGSLSGEMSQLPVLARGRHFTLYCLDRGGCPKRSR